LVQRIEEKRKQLLQKQNDIQEIISELDLAEEQALTRMAELGVGS